MTNRTDNFPPASCRMPKTPRMKRKKLAEPEFSMTKSRQARMWRCKKVATGGSPFAPLRIPPVNQPKEHNNPGCESAGVGLDQPASA